MERACRELFFDVSTNVVREKSIDLRIFQHLKPQSIIGPEGANDSMAHLYAEEYK